jgi:hypothetical protein
MDTICPFLGLFDDPKTSTIYPNNCNACYRADPAKLVAIHHQRDVCLTEKHNFCEGFTTGWQSGFPPSLRNNRYRRRLGFLSKLAGKLSAAWTVGIGLLAIVVVLGAYLSITNLGLPSIPTPPMLISTEDITVTETHIALGARLTPSETPTKTATSTPTAVSTNTPTPDFTPTQTPGPDIKTPFGSQDFQLLIHEVQDQESITSIANQYNTTVDVLWLLNGLAFQTIQVGDPVVVCVGCTDTHGLPPLQAVYLTAGITLSELANQYNAAFNQLREWNDLGESDWIEGERWVVVPFE